MNEKGIRLAFWYINNTMSDEKDVKSKCSTNERKWEVPPGNSEGVYKETVVALGFLPATVTLQLRVEDLPLPGVDTIETIHPEDKSQYAIAVFTAFTKYNKEPTFNPNTMNFLCYQTELTKNGFAHYQGYVEFKSRHRIAGMQSQLGLSQKNWFAKKSQYSTQYEAALYCLNQLKDSAVMGSSKKYGTLIGQGKGAHKVMLADAKDADLGEMVKKYGDQVSTRINVVNELYWVNGARDLSKKIGKPEICDDPKREYVIPKGAYMCKELSYKAFFDGYDRQEVFVIDRKYKYNTDMLSEICSGAQVILPLKGKYTYFCSPKVMIIGLGADDLNLDIKFF